jgi:hypothetical protein
MLEAREKYILSGTEEKEANRGLYEKRRAEYDSALNAPPEWSAAEEDELRARVRESLDYLEPKGGPLLRIVEAIRGWESACGEVLAQVDIALELYEKTLNGMESSPGANANAILSAEDVKTLENRDMNDILPVNAVYVAPIYADAIEDLKRLLGKRESEA